MRALAFIALALLAACTPQPRAETPVPPRLMDWPDLLSRPMPSPTEEIRFAPGAAGVAGLWLPAGDGPFPVVLMVHGGCWHTAIADHTIMNYAAEALRQQGMAVWNIEYRGVDDEGGGYPGTYQDVARAADALRDLATRNHLDLTRVVGFGHSAGGHLVAWLAARHNLPHSSPLYSARPLPLKAVTTVGGLQDLRTAPEGCSASSVNAMLGEASAARPDVYSDTSPASLLPLGIHTVVVNGDSDPVAPPAMGAAYVALARAAGDRVEQIAPADSGHAEEIAPGTAAFSAEIEVLRRLARE